jgi:Gas vesicle synthesis protein GvpL/GvpF
VVYVYGFVRAGALERFRHEGVGSADATVVEGDGIAAIVSPVRTADMKLKRRDLHRHLGVIESAFQSTTVIPCAFGTIVESSAELEDGVLVGAREDLLEGFERLDGTVQMNVKATYDEEELLREIVAADPQVMQLRERTRAADDAGYSDRVRLGEIVAARIDERTERDAARVAEALASHSVDIVLEPADRGVALRGAFLVERKSLARFESALEEISRAEQPLLRFEAIGPLPPTAFAASYVSSGG